MDKLSDTSRAFYERAKMKTAVGLYMAAVSCMFMGFTCQFGGEASHYNFLYKWQEDNTLADDQYHTATADRAGGYGFATFCYIVAAILAASMSIFLCVPLCGSAIEKRTLNSPEEIESTNTSSPAGANVPVAVAVPEGGGGSISKQVV